MVVILVTHRRRRGARALALSAKSAWGFGAAGRSRRGVWGLPGRWGGVCPLAEVGRSTPPAAGLHGPILRTNRGQTIKRPDRLSGDQAPDLHFLVAGAGFEPATS